MEIKWEAVPWWNLAAVAVTLGAFCYFLMRRRFPARFLLLRGTTLAVLVLALARPTRVIRESTESKPTLVVLLDVSKSMATADPESRIDRAREFLRRTHSSLEKKFSVRYHSFADSPIKTSLENLLRSESPRGTATHLATALEAIQGEYRGQVSIFLVLTDGAVTEERPLAALAREWNVPMIVVDPTGSKSWKDLSVAEVRASDFAFKYTPVQVAASVMATGFEGQSIPVVLKRNQDILSTRQLSIAQDGRTEEILFTLTPRDTGEAIYSVEIPPHQGEISTANNTQSFSLRVGREKIRVLYICGQPSSEYYFLRHLLKSEPSVELVSFVILRNPESLAVVPENELSLIPFPTRDIFANDLFGFDVLVMENFSTRNFGIIREYLDNIRGFVEKGGGFVMMGGTNAFGSGGYTGTPIDPLLPISISREEIFQSEGFVLEPHHLDHPIWNGVKNSLGQLVNWKSQMSLEGANRFGTVRPQATVLGVKSGGEKYPVLVVSRRGRGRVMAMASNTTWRWALTNASRDGSTPLYEKFWWGALRWLSGAEEFKNVRISFLNQKPSVSDKTGFVVFCFDDSYKPLSDARIQLVLTDPRGVSTDLTGYFRSEGQYTGDFIPTVSGPYKLKAKVFVGSRLLGEEERILEVLTQSVEDRMILPNPALLKELASASGGRYTTPDQFDMDQLASLPFKSVKAPVKQEVALWNSAWLYGLLVALLIAEWYGRRKSGLL